MFSFKGDRQKIVGRIPTVFRGDGIRNGMPQLEGPTSISYYEIANNLRATYLIQQIQMKDRSKRNPFIVSIAVITSFHGISGSDD